MVGSPVSTAHDPLLASKTALVQAAVRSIPDFPKPGILFRDITPVLADRVAFAAAADLHVAAAAALGEPLDVVLGIESRGFLFGATLATRLGLGFVPARKPGKLPGRVHEEHYGLEYGEATLQVHDDGLAPGSRVLIVDDLLATGGTAGAAMRLVERSRATTVGCLFLIELDDLGGRQRLGDVPVSTILHY
ncbi:MAG: adenine phosphoribosyltransferase [Myxococcales bacterium FL481]|nr:MAG: adenine phosphoribosyltransferase [Myxococcales bacterium FL481]